MRLKKVTRHLSQSKAAHGSGEANTSPSVRGKLRNRADVFFLKMIKSRHMLIGKEVEANLGNVVGLYDSG